MTTEEWLKHEVKAKYYTDLAAKHGAEKVVRSLLDVIAQWKDIVDKLRKEARP